MSEKRSVFSMPLLYGIARGDCLYLFCFCASLPHMSITEGVETEEQVDNLTKLGCDVFQGYYFSKAIDVNEFEKRYLYRKKAG